MTTIYRDIGFVHLHVHSAYSLLEGALRIPQLADLAKADAMPALAITDTNNLFGALEFSEKLAGSGIQPIIGMQLNVDFGDVATNPMRPTSGRDSSGRVILLAMDATGYQHLMQLTSAGFIETDPAEDIHVCLDLLKTKSAGLICLSGGPDGPIDRALSQSNPDLAGRRFEQLSATFGNRFYVELQRHDIASERANEPALLDLAYRHGVGIVATNQALFASADDHEAHDALLAIAEGRLLSDEQRNKRTPGHTFKTRREMQALFADLPEALANTIEIAMRCHYRPKALKTPVLPRFSVEGDEGEELRAQAHKGLAERMARLPLAPGFDADAYRARLDFEISVITKMQFPGYFLIVAEFIGWAKSKGIPVGPGRGSGAGSLVAYALGITDVDPLRFNLLFERFLNPDRVSMPDFDIDFCQDRRDEVIRHVQERYGYDRVAQIITFGTLQARGVMRDVGRVLEMPYGQVDRLTKLVPAVPGKPVTLADALKDEPRLRNEAREDQRVGLMLEIAQKLEGLNRHASTHAAGIVISERALTEMVPLYRDPKSDMPVTQFNMKWVEQAGLVKFDFLGLKTLSVLQRAVDLVSRRGVSIDLLAIPLDDAPTYAMLSRAESVGIFQLESAGMRRALIEMKPDRFEDIIALVALYRPGPMANIPVYCDCKHGRSEPNYIHPDIKAVLEETYGVIVYQEQVMQIAQLLSGYSLGEADLLRRAMGKKIRAEMDQQSSRFVDGCTSRGIVEDKAREIFALLEKFADYGFNKSHAAAYALIAYQTAFMKAHHPVEFLAASMDYDLSNTEKLVEFRREAQRMGIPVQAPSVQRSGERFGVDDGAVCYALSAIKGVGVEAARHIATLRQEGGPFRSLNDFASRIDPRLLNRKTLETLAASGAMEELHANRAALVAGSDAIMAIAQENQRSKVDGQVGLFGMGDDATGLQLPKTQNWAAMERLQREFSAIGFFLSGHPLDEYAAALGRLRISTHAEFMRTARVGESVSGRLAATVIDKQERKTKKGTRMGILSLSDQSGQYEAVIFAERLNDYGDLLKPGTAVVIGVVANMEEEGARLIVQTVEPLAEIAQRVSKGVRIFIRDEAPVDGLKGRLIRKGEGEVTIVVMAPKEEVSLQLPGRFDVSPAVVAALKSIQGVVAVESV